MLKGHLALFVVVVFAAFWVRVAGLNAMPPGLHNDEIQEAERAWRVASGYGLPLIFRDSPEPFDPIIRAPYVALAGAAPFTIRLFTVFLNVLAAAAAVGAARALYYRSAQREVIALVAGLTMAVIPAYIVMGRGIYRGHWVPLMILLALMLLAWGWRTRRMRYFLGAGVATGLAAMTYLAGLAFPPIVAVILALNALLDRRAWPGIRNLLALGAAMAVTMLPWLYFLAVIPNWLTLRIDQAAQQRVDPLADPSGFAAHAWRAIRPIYQADTFIDPRYNTYTTAFLNPALLILLLIGLSVCLWRWRRVGYRVPLLTFLAMLLPAVLTGEPEQPIRLVGIFGPLALIAGVGAGAVYASARTAALRRAVQAGLVALVVISPLYSWWHVRYHFTEQPRLFSDPASWLSIARYYNLGFRDLMQYVAESPRPVYIPLDYTSLIWQRPRDFPVVRGYGGGPLPAGEILLPVSDVYGIPPARHPIQYILMLPQSGEIVILPPFSLEESTALREAVLTAGQPVVGAHGWVIGHTLPVDAADNPFVKIEQPAFDAPLAVFDERLELLHVSLPHTITPGEWVPATFYWRLAQPTGQDYFMYAQFWDTNNQSFGSQDDHFAPILPNLYPTVMWMPGEVIAETRWVQLYEDAPPGGYRLMISVFVHPGPQYPAIGTGRGVQGVWVDVARPVVPLAFAVPENLHPVDALLGGALRLNGLALDTPLDQLRAGETLALRLAWEAQAQPAEDYTIFIHLRAANGDLVAQADSQPLDGRYPTGNWGAGEQVVTAHQLLLPQDAPPGPYSLAVGMYRWPSLERLEVIQGGSPQPDRQVIWP